MARFVGFPPNTVRTWRVGNVVKSVEGWSPLHRYVRAGAQSSPFRDSIEELRAAVLSPEDEKRRERLKQFWTKLTPSGSQFPVRT
jgi:hypothetical protein